jgi:hypothetical protein
MLMIAGTNIYCYSEDSSDVSPAMTVQGNVSAIDWVGSVFTVNDMEFSVPSNVEVRKGTDKISFSGINVNDSVTVIYSKDKDGSLKASKIVIAYSGDLPV